MAPLLYKDSSVAPPTNIVPAIWPLLLMEMARIRAGPA